MGGTESRFNALLVEGDEKEALALWHAQPELQARFRPGVPIKSSPYRDKPLHCAARGSMKVLMHEFLSRGADPRAKNDSGETPLHIVCRSARFSSRTNRLRAELLRLLLDNLPPTDREKYENIGMGVWSTEVKCEGEMRSKAGSSLSLGRDSLFSNGAGERLDPYNMAVLDRSSNTPLHLAAASGLLLCVELLLAHSAPLFVFNIAGQTPCDVAAEAKQLIIAKLLESKMVLTGDSDGGSTKRRVISRARSRSFHNTHTLTKLRADIIQQVARDLQISDFCAEALLMAYSWSEDLVKEAWFHDRHGACEKAGLDPDTVQLDEEDYAHSNVTMSLSVKLCEICFGEFTPNYMVQVPCSHRFCVECWKSYLTGEIMQGQGKEIRCPGHGCYKIVPNETVSDLVPDHLYQKYASLNLKNFVDTYSAVKWCPYPDCESAVSVKKEGGGVRGGAKAERPKTDESSRICLGFNVECRNGHGFCWHCMKEPHEPCDCELWQKWKEHIRSMGDVDGAIAKLGREAAANAKWIVQFTKPCPNCKSPIQKNDGCNHMTCKTCRYDFCWVCLDPWHLHSNKTGGYFMCNRYKEQAEARLEVEKARKGIMDDYMKNAQETQVKSLEKFKHYYSRYDNHLNSLEMELLLLQESKKKTAELAKLGQVLEKKVAAARKEVCIASDSDPEEEGGATDVSPDTNFLDDVIRVLLNARRILSASYCIGYFIPPESTELIQAHDTLQGKLEEVVEMLSQMVNRPYLLTPQGQISETARNVDHMCEEYLSEMREVAWAAAEHSAKLARKPPPKPARYRRDTPARRPPLVVTRPDRPRRPTPAHPARRARVRSPEPSIQLLTSHGTLI